MGRAFRPAPHASTSISDSQTHGSAFSRVMMTHQGKYFSPKSSFLFPSRHENFHSLILKMSHCLPESRHKSWINNDGAIYVRVKQAADLPRRPARSWTSCCKSDGSSLWGTLTPYQVMKTEILQVCTKVPSASAVLITSIRVTFRSPAENMCTHAGGGTTHHSGGFRGICVFKQYFQFKRHVLKRNV